MDPPRSSALDRPLSPDKQIKIGLVRSSAGGRLENFEIGGVVPRAEYRGVEAAVSLLAGVQRFCGPGHRFHIGMKDRSFDMTALGGGFKVGAVMGVSFVGSEVNVDLEKIDFKQKGKELAAGKIDLFTRHILCRHPVGRLIWLVT
ncbi:hypothetical protein FIBSPDRAFT_868543 [Athelia psychrophila]|uniref:Uncharacterized protein n=1 Tax=Athelia psychrophila TaxID=1759441 RepID=A0A166CZL6_9AGAM|nr:hypothetical protein FIBSPDRAFT_868543 [Fibularhizoctonia sp. CBS 109695]